MVDYRYMCEHSRVASRSSTAWLGTTMQMHWLCIFRVYFLLAHIAYYTGHQVVHFDLKVNMCRGMSLDLNYDHDKMLHERVKLNFSDDR